MRFKLGQKGFTLVELMVVVAILSVLMAIVAPAVTGTKEMSVSGQVKSDADATQKATDNYSNKAIKAGFPTAAPSSSGPVYNLVNYGSVWTDNASGNNVILVDKNNKFIGQLSSTVLPSGALGTANYTTLAHEYMDFGKSTSVYDATGAVKDATFVPDFLMKKPTSLLLAGMATRTLGETLNVYPEFLWLAKVNAPGTSQEGRNLEVFRLQDKVTASVTLTDKDTAATVFLITDGGLSVTQVDIKSAGQPAAFAAGGPTSIIFTTTNPISGTPATGLLVYQQIF